MLKKFNPRYLLVGALMILIIFLLLNMNKSSVSESHNQLFDGVQNKKLSINADDQQYRVKQSKERNLSNIMQKRLHFLQNPPNCSTARKLVCKFDFNFCGVGCNMHRIAVCFIAAYASQRTLVFGTKMWEYSGGWEAIFHPISPCQSNNDIKGQYLL